MPVFSLIPGVDPAHGDLRGETFGADGHGIAVGGGKERIDAGCEQIFFFQNFDPAVREEKIRVRIDGSTGGNARGTARFGSVTVRNWQKAVGFRVKAATDILEIGFFDGPEAEEKAVHGSLI